VVFGRYRASGCGGVDLGDAAPGCLPKGWETLPFQEWNLAFQRLRNRYLFMSISLMDSG
jgi:hypothetical protein